MLGKLDISRTENENDNETLLSKRCRDWAWKWSKVLNSLEIFLVYKQFKLL